MTLAVDVSNLAVAARDYPQLDVRLWNVGAMIGQALYIPVEV